VTERLAEVSSPASVDAELRALHTLMETAEEWGHRAKGENPFSGKTKVEGRRRRKKTREATGERHYTFEQVRAILKKATEEATDWNRRRLRALVYFVAYTGARINEVIQLEWKDIDFEEGVAWLHHTVDRDLKTEASAAPFGLTAKLLAVLREWEAEKNCEWVFPNTSKKPWKSGAPGYRHFDQLQDLGKRAGVEGANWKRFRHTLATLGKGRFGMTREQVQAQLRHTLESTQDNYSHDDLASLRGAVQAIDFD
jgi:integrase